MTAQKREFNERAREFYLNRTLPLKLINTFHDWKDYVFTNEKSINSKIAELERKLLIKRVQNVLYTLKGIFLNLISHIH